MVVNKETTSVIRCLFWQFEFFSTKQSIFNVEAGRLDNIVMSLSSVEPVPIAEFVPSVNSATSLNARQNANPARSWVFRILDILGLLLSRIFGIASIIVCAAVAANLPIVQLLSLGYLLEVSGRIARSGKVSDGLVGVSKASKIGGIIFGTWLLLIPVRFFSDSFWYEAWLIDPLSNQTVAFRITQIVLIFLTAAQIVAAWLCGGKLRYFFWQLIAPFSFALWAFRKMLGSDLTRPILSFSLNWVSPNLTDDICNAKPPQDWFVPAILSKKFRDGNVYAEIRDGLWTFIGSLNLWYYFNLGLRGLMGTVAWLFLPTLLLIAATLLEGPLAIASGLFGLLFAIPIFAILPFVQAHFARSGKLSSFLEVGTVLRFFKKAPLAHVFALLLTLAFALPLFLLKIEPVPAELLWTLSLVFIVFSWPSRIVIAWAYHRGSEKTSPGCWWIRWPLILLAIPISAAFGVILSLTRYVSWNGAWSLIENHVFLLPAPFWL